MRCPHCAKVLGGLNKAGEHRIRLGIVLVDPTTGRVHGPCTHCKGDVTVAEGSTLSKSLTGAVRPGLRLRKP